MFGSRVEIKCLDGKMKNIDFSYTLFVFIDVQNDFITGDLGTEAAKMAQLNVLKMAQVPMRYCAATLDTHYPYNYDETLEGHYLPVTHCMDGTYGARTPKGLQDIWMEKKVKPKFFRKETFGSFELVEYAKRLFNENKIDNVVFVGFCTDICVISNVLMVKAAIPNAVIAVVEDACAGVTPETHSAAIEVMKKCHIDVVKTEVFYKKANDLEARVNQLVYDGYM